MLRVSLLGNLGADPEARYSQKGSAITSFRVAANQVRTMPDGERQEHTEWFRVRAGGRLAEFAQRLTKGSRVLVVGRLEISHYQSREGEPRVGFDIWADEVINLSGSRPGGAEGDDGQERLAGGEDEGTPVGARGPERPVESDRRDAATARRPALAGAGARGGRGPADEDLEDLPF